MNAREVTKKNFWKFKNTLKKSQIGGSLAGANRVVPNWGSQIGGSKSGVPNRGSQIGGPKSGVPNWGVLNRGAQIGGPNRGSQIGGPGGGGEGGGGRVPYEGPKSGCRYSKCTCRHFSEQLQKLQKTRQNQFSTPIFLTQPSILQLSSFY
jgi:hypothetical protein